MAQTSWSDIEEVGNQACAHLRKVLEIDPERLEVYPELWNILFALGKTDEASIVLQQSDELKRQISVARQEDQLDLRFVSPQCLGTMGILGHLINYIKAGLLGWRPPGKLVMLVSDDTQIANPCFLDYWRQYLTLITDPETIDTLSPMASHLEEPLSWGFSCNGQALFYPTAANLVANQWDIENRPPLMTLSTSDYKRGWKCLEDLGVPRDAWFVCLHVRDGGFYGEGDNRESYRNADIESYVMAIETIVAHGGWVIRMGDPNMKPLSPMDQVIDYAHSDVHTDWMDVFLAAQCRFFIGTSSGLAALPIAFGVLCVHTNYLPWVGMHFSGKDLFIPRMIWSTNESRLITFPEIMSSSLGQGADQCSYDRLGVEILENKPEEINDVVSEMLMRLDGKISYTESDEQLQTRLRSLTSACAIGPNKVMINARIGREFLRKYAALLDAPPRTADDFQNQANIQV
tara:strand:- start:10523 stop:11902 length:1380 start_codon:yes stop_codon:yes gene_type:complete